MANSEYEHSERACLGCALLKNSLLSTLLVRLKPEHFELSLHQDAFRAMLESAKQRFPFTATSLAASLSRYGDARDQLEEMSADAVLHDGLIARHVQTVIRGWKMRQLRVIVERAWNQKVNAPKADPDQLLQELEAEFQPLMDVPTAGGNVIIPVSRFLATIPDDISWMVNGVIERGANGFICADPKIGKSWVAADMVLCLAMGLPWMGFTVNRPYKVALISREDTPGLTAWRLKHLLTGKSGDASYLESNLWINTRQQTDSFKLDHDEELAGMIHAMTERRIEFAIFDVMNVLHSSDENDNQEMRKVLAKLSEISTKVGCGIGVVHHYKKDETGSMTKRLRGSSAISGWAEWMIGLTRVGEEKIRRMEFELKAATPPDPIHFLIDSDDSSGVAVLKHVDYNATKAKQGSLLQ